MCSMGVVKHSTHLILKFLDFLRKSWEHHTNVLKNSEKINVVDLNSLFANIRNYKEIKSLRKYIMKDSNKKKYEALVSRKEVTNRISNSDDSDQGETSNDNFLYELIASAALIIKHYEESKSNGV